MGTRNLTMVFKDGEYKVAQYGQWDGYPEGQGLIVLSFVRDDMDRARFLANLAKCRDEDSDETDRRYREVGHDGSRFVSFEVSKRFKDHWPHLNRDMGGRILAAIQAADDGLDLRRDPGFAADSLMCEWAYVVDFDAGTLEAFKGFNKAPLEATARFASLPLQRDSGDYYQIKLAKSWPLDALPDDDEFLTALKHHEEDGEEAA